MHRDNSSTHQDNSFRQFIHHDNSFRCTYSQTSDSRSQTRTLTSTRMKSPPPRSYQLAINFISPSYQFAINFISPSYQLAINFVSPSCQFGIILLPPTLMKSPAPRSNTILAQFLGEGGGTGVTRPQETIHPARATIGL